MIITKLKGGLGNQLFQYAVGRHLSEIHKTELKIDISMFATYELHEFSIWPFNIQENLALPEEVWALTILKSGIMERVVNRVLGKHLKPKRAATRVQEKYFHFDHDILNLPDNVYLDGYWQSEKYFTDIESIIRREFTIKSPQKGKDEELAEQIFSCESVSLHIRRGSYLLPLHYPILGICSLDYYLRGVKYLTQTLRDPHFFIFSDDPQWARDNLKISYPTTHIDHNGADKDYEDLRLISQCKHHIIANSTFSWWGAWLCTNSKKLVIAPKDWFNLADYNTSDLIPETWVRM